jgi:undecaprenyl-diphosphatase
MLEILKAVLFGIIEGITEWLPISSTGHLILLEEIVSLKVTDAFYEMFQVVIQLGAILAVVLLFFNKLNPFSPKKNEKQKMMTWSLWFKVIIAVLPSAVIGLFLDDWLDAHLYNYFVVAVTLVLYGAAFLLVEQKNKALKPKVGSVYALDMRTALFIGCFQCLALIPGTSRSGATILGAIFLGVSRSAASEFSFFLAIPTMLGASALKILKFMLEGAKISGLEIGILLVGCVVAFLVSLLAINGLMQYVKKNNFAIFGHYRIALGILILVYFLIQILIG